MHIRGPFGAFCRRRPNCCHRLHPRSGLTGHAPGPGPSAGHGVPMGRSGTGAFSPSMIFLFSTDDVSAPNLDAAANRRIRSHSLPLFSQASFQFSCGKKIGNNASASWLSASFRLIPVELSSAKQSWSFRIPLSSKVSTRRARGKMDEQTALHQRFKIGTFPKIRII